MIAAVFGDIAGNLCALRAAFGAVEAQGIQTILHTGNAAAGAEMPNECVEWLGKSGAICVQGEDDRFLVRYERKADTIARKVSEAKRAALQRAFETLRGANLEWLRCLPRERRLQIDEVELLLCHTFPGGKTEYLAEDTPRMKFERAREIAACGIVVCGGSGSAYARTIADTLFVHPGPVCPEPGVASYTLVSTEKLPWSAWEERVTCNDARA